ncbi:hypothetical protein E0493_12190 [Roseomonas sp. M0104]|uniref:Uncharacterized protein n=1 Tax=Teichococcus coralli TaxID=2545983 RepID=A0A845BDH8_9PROT|nr:hypothetical protein [Pseudoroseomonas coralli]MXP64104.1 hypothetical protein [Pseudoroseomonas coralli]
MPYLIKLISPSGAVLYGARQQEGQRAGVSSATAAERFVSRKVAEEALSQLRREPRFQGYSFAVIEP